jgi:hypothetical protein
MALVASSCHTYLPTWACPWTPTNNLWRWSSCVLDVSTCKAPLPSTRCHFWELSYSFIATTTRNTHKTWQLHFFTPLCFQRSCKLFKDSIFIVIFKHHVPKCVIFFYHSLFLGLGRGAWSLQKVGILLQWQSSYLSLIWMVVNWGPQLMLQELLAPHRC